MKCVLLLILFVAAQAMHSQKADVAPKDSLRFYKKIKKLAYRYNATRLLYQYVFVDPEPQEYPVNPASGETKNVNPYRKYEKKIIRKIYITVYDPFGYAISDPVPLNINGFQRWGNRLHVKTRQWIINNRLLFKENDTLNALQLSETERLLREAGFVNDARVFVMDSQNSDSVDVSVIVVDKWTVAAPAEVTRTSANIRLQNQNLFGTGQGFEQYVGYRAPDVYEHNASYHLANIDNTYISSLLSYRHNIDGTQVNLDFNRPFFTPLVKWAYGAGFNNFWSYFTYTDSLDSVPRRSRVSVFNYDFWVSRAIKLGKDKSFFNQSTNIILGARHFKNIFWDRPSYDIDKGANATSLGVLGNVGFAIQQYYKDKYIYRFGANEDVPEGLIMTATYGILKPEFKKVRYYTGAEIARAKHFDFGYVSSTMSGGVFFNDEITNNITLNYKITYFSNLLQKRRWLFRQFLTYNVVHGINKPREEKIRLHYEELYGFDNGDHTGQTKMVFNSETVAYAPYNIVGFRIAPVMQVGLGMIGEPGYEINKSHLYQGYSLGIMFRNENLLTSTFYASIGFYPVLPDGRSNRVVWNPVTSFTLRVRAFSVSRPEFVSYN